MLPRSRRRSRRSAGRTGTRRRAVDLVEEHPGLVVEQRRLPSAALESAAVVLVRRAEPLHHAVDGDHGRGRQLHGCASLLVGLVASDRSAIAHLLFREHFRLSIEARPPTFHPRFADKRLENEPSRQYFGDRVPHLASAMCSGGVARFATKNFRTRQREVRRMLHALGE